MPYERIDAVKKASKAYLDCGDDFVNQIAGDGAVMFLENADAAKNST